MKLTLTPDERVEYEALLAEVQDATTVTSERADLMLQGLRDAEQAGRTWASRVMADALSDGVSKLVKNKAKSRHRTGYTSRNGNVIDLSAVSGVLRNGKWHQLEFEQMNRDELAAHLDLIDAQLVALGARKGAIGRFLRIYDQYPDAASLSDALDAAGQTLDDVLAAA